MIAEAMLPLTILPMITAASSTSMPRGGHDRPAGNFGDAHHRADEQELVEAVRDAGEPGQNRKGEDRGDEDWSAADAIRQCTEDQCGYGPGDGEDRSQHADLRMR